MVEIKLISVMQVSRRIRYRMLGMLLFFTLHLNF